ncbi:TetR family transcriptional regulator [Paeniglutamicibacter terrestris]|uniref:TetR/AcrR family transcriptional regulator n=1 Tax=Paeniglutamicibacter terrestris TaxID=2723403 RepID=A0ABX1G3B1_9MICC|nr:TetR/AcrR family transcriptional regulator [Paeniglutamicibacter terrestris]
MSGKSSTGKPAKAPLDREVFVEAAFRLASRPHTLTLTYRDLGKEVGVDPTAIYRHFQSKESLMEELLDRLYKMAHARMTTPTAQWEDCLTEFAGATLDTFLEYPAIAVTATSLTTRGQGELDSIELMLACFSEAGLEGRALAEQYAIFGAYVLASAAGLARDHAESADSDSHEWFTGPLFADPSRHPLVASLREEILALDHREIFLAGVRQIIGAAKATSPA